MAEKRSEDAQAGDRESRKNGGTPAGGDAPTGASTESSSSGTDNSAPPRTRDGLAGDSAGDDSAGDMKTTPTTAEEAMDTASDESGFIDESAYAPTDLPSPTNKER